jgi:hypothetical protein
MLPSSCNALLTWGTDVLALGDEETSSTAEASWVLGGGQHSSTGAAADSSAALSLVQAVLMLPPLHEEVAVGTLVLALLHWLAGVAVAAVAPYAGVASLPHSWALRWCCRRCSEQPAAKQHSSKEKS